MSSSCATGPFSDAGAQGVVRAYTVASLFSGAGGMDKGFADAGFDIVWANDISKDAARTYELNLGHEVETEDIRRIPSDRIAPGMDVDVVLGGFPCQGFSVNNTSRSMEDSRNRLYLEMARVISDKRPAFFVAENVKGLLSMEKGAVIKAIIEDFESLGYKVEAKVLNAARYGIPQARERVIIIGNRLGVENPFPEPTHRLDGDEGADLPPAVTTEQAIGFLADVRANACEMRVAGRRVLNHVASTNVSDRFWARKHDVDQAEVCDYLREWRSRSGLTVEDIDRRLGYAYTAGHWFRKDASGSIPSPDDWWSLKGILGFDDRYDALVTELVERPITFEQSLRITNWDRPSDTITATCPEIHVNRRRRLSVRECAILQSFPDDYEFTGSVNSMYRQVGNAVPPLLARRIAEGIRQALERAELGGRS